MGAPERTNDRGNKRRSASRREGVRDERREGFAEARGRTRAGRGGDATRGSATPPTPVRPARVEKSRSMSGRRGAAESRPPGGFDADRARVGLRGTVPRVRRAPRGVVRARAGGRGAETRRRANPSEKCQRASEGGADARVREPRTVELDETLALLAVDHRDGGLLATEALDLMGGGAWGRRRQSRVPGRGEARDRWSLGFYANAGHRDAGERRLGARRAARRAARAGRDARRGHAPSWRPSCLGVRRVQRATRACKRDACAASSGTSSLFARTSARGAPR